MWFALSDALKSHWDKVSAKTTITVEELNQLENLADRVNQALGVRSQAPRVAASAARDRQAAYTLFVEAYGEVRAAIAYVRRKENDVDLLMPSLFVGHGGRRKKPVVHEQPSSSSPATQAGEIRDAPATRG